MKNKDKARKAEEQMASNCCYRLEPEEKLPGRFPRLQHSPLLQKNLPYVLIHIHHYVNLRLTALWMRAYGTIL